MDKAVDLDLDLRARAEAASAMGTAKLVIEAEMKLRDAHLLVARLDHRIPDEHMFLRPDVYWVDLCLTPRRPKARARYVDLWGPHRFSEMGSIIALPPGFKLHLKSEGGAHASLICALAAGAVNRWLPEGFEWTDRQLEACLNLPNADIRAVLVRLSHELRHPDTARREACTALVDVLAIDIARALLGMEEQTRHGGLASWRLRIIDKRLADPGLPPSLEELATLCAISVRQLTRGFRASRGCSVGDYLAQHRIDNAKRRLATDESIKSIASATGFASPSAFTYAFRIATGMTPRTFRQRVLQGMERDP